MSNAPQVVSCVIYSKSFTIPVWYRTEFKFSDNHLESYDISSDNVTYWKNKLGTNFDDSLGVFEGITTQQSNTNQTIPSQTVTIPAKPVVSGQAKTVDIVDTVKQSDN